MLRFYSDQNENDSIITQYVTVIPGSVFNRILIISTRVGPYRDAIRL